MGSYLVSFQQIASLLFLIFLGVVGKKKGLITAEGRKTLVSILIYFTLPALVLTSTTSPKAGHSFQTALLAVVLGLIIRLVSLLLGHAISRFLGYRKDERAIFTFQMTFGNAGFMGLPVCYALWGEAGAFLGALFNLSHEFLMWTLGVWLISREGLEDWRKLLSPPGLAAVVGLIFFGLNWQLPTFASSILGMLGAASTPLAMLVVGSQLRFAGVSKREWGLLLSLAFLRLLLVPAGVFYLLDLLALPKLLVQVATVITAMPASSMITVIAAQVDGNVELASATTLLTTTLSAVTLPLIVALVS